MLNVIKMKMARGHLYLSHTVYGIHIYMIMVKVQSMFDHERSTTVFALNDRDFFLNAGTVTPQISVQDDTAGNSIQLSVATNPTMPNGNLAMTRG